MPAPHDQHPLRHDDAQGAHRRLDLRWSLGLALLHGLLFAGSFPPIDLWPLIVFAPAPLVWIALRASRLRLTLLVLFGTQMLMWLWLNRWLMQVTGAGYIGLCFYQSIYPTFFVLLLRGVHVAPAVRRVPMAVLVPVLWTAVEAARGEFIMHGYPWYLLAHPLIEAPMLVQSADLFGTYFISFLGAAVSGAIVEVALFRVGERSRLAALVASGCVVAVWLGNVGYGMWRIGQGGALVDGPAVLVIQMNLPQSNKVRWTFEAQKKDFAHFVKLTRQSYAAQRSAGREIDLIVWPETMLPGFGLEPEVLKFFEDHPYEPGDVFTSGIRRLAGELDTPILVGSPSYFGLDVEDGKWVWDRHYNSAYLVQGDPPYPRYDKVFLTPFGETMPYISAWPWLEERMLDFGARGMSFDLDAAPSPSVIEAPWNGQTVRSGTPICFEDTVSSVVRRMAYADGEKRLDVIINLSNDGWFGWDDSGRRTHAQIARFRAIENRVPVIRAANTGLSLAVDANGIVVAQIGRGRYGEGRMADHLWHRVRLDSRESLFGRVGNVWAWGCLACAAMLVMVTLVGRRGLNSARPTTDL